MEQRRIGVLHPGEMGSAVGRVLAAAGHQVLWASDGRSKQTLKRSEAAGLIDDGTVETLARQAEIVLSICPPHAATEVAREVADLRFTGIYADCNAVSPRRTRAIEEIVATGGGTYVDGGIVGGPPSERSQPTLYLSSVAAGTVAACFASTGVRAVVLSERIGAASALKMAYAANSKGTSALFAAILALAEQEGVREALQNQWGEELTTVAHDQTIESTLKAWRFVGEMHEIADTFADAGLPSSFPVAAAEIYERLAGFKGRVAAPKLEEVLGVLQQP